MIDPRSMRLFLAVCEEGSIGAAARRLGLAQPSVSVAIGQLERRLGTPLLHRSRKGVAPTEAGVALHQRAKRMDNLLREAEEAVHLAGQGGTGPLRIGGTPGALVTLVPAAIGRLGGGQPASIHVIERSDEQLTDLLRRGEIEIAAVTTEVVVPPPDIAELSVTRDPFALIVGRAHERLGPAVALAGLAGHEWVLPRAAGAFHRQIEALFLADGAPMPANVIRCDSLLTSKEIVRRTARVTLLPRGVVAPELATGVLRAIPIAGAELSRRVGIRTLAGHPLSGLGERFRSALLAAFQA